MTTQDTAQGSPPAVSPPAHLPAAPKWFAAFGLVAGVGAIIASSCCVIPLGLAAVGAGASIFGGLEMVAEWRVPLLSLSGLAIAGGWGAWWFKQPVACEPWTSCATPQRSRSTLALLLCASTIVLAAASWDYIDPVLLKLIRSH